MDARGRCGLPDVAAIGNLDARLSVSVIVGNPARLSLGALDAQSYPEDLIEVVVAHDELDRGIAKATGEVLVLLDEDATVTDTMVAAHARWHHAEPRAAVVGAVPGDADHAPTRCDPWEVSGTHLSVPAVLLEEVGGLSDLRGAEAGAELGWRLAAAGAILIRDPAVGRAGTRVFDPEAGISTDLLQRVPPLRPAGSSRRCLVPRVLVEIVVDGTTDSGALIDAADTALASTPGDAVLHITGATHLVDESRIQAAFAAEPRLTGVASSRERPRHWQYLLRIPASLRVSSWTVAWLCGVMARRDVGAVRVSPPPAEDTPMEQQAGAMLVDAAAWHRARALAHDRPGRATDEGVLEILSQSSGEWWVGAPAAGIGSVSHPPGGWRAARQRSTVRLAGELARARADHRQEERRHTATSRRLRRTEQALEQALERAEGGVSQARQSEALRLRLERRVAKLESRLARAEAERDRLRARRAVRAADAAGRWRRAARGLAGRDTRKARGQ